MSVRRALPLAAALALLGACRTEPFDTERPTAPGCDAAPPTLHDRERAKQLEEALGSLADDGRVPTLEELQRDVEPPAVRALPAAAAIPAAEIVAPSDLYERLSASVVAVGKRYLCGRCEHWHTSSASGFAIAPDTIVTSHHVLGDRGDSRFAIMTHEGRVLPVIGVVGSDVAADVVVLRVDADDLVPLPLRPGARPGTAVHVLSHPSGAYYYLTSGLLARRFPFRRGSGPTTEMLDITAAFAKGSSGAPVVDPSGAVIGVVRATDSVYYSENEGRQRDLQMVFRRCTPIEAVLALVD